MKPCTHHHCCHPGELLHTPCFSRPGVRTCKAAENWLPLQDPRSSLQCTEVGKRQDCTSGLASTRWDAPHGSCGSVAAVAHKVTASSTSPCDNPGPGPPCTHPSRPHLCQSLHTCRQCISHLHRCNDHDHRHCRIFGQPRVGVGKSLRDMLPGGHPHTGDPNGRPNPRAVPSELAPHRSSHKAVPSDMGCRRAPSPGIVQRIPCLQPGYSKAWIQLNSQRCPRANTASSYKRWQCCRPLP